MIDYKEFIQTIDEDMTVQEFITRKALSGKAWTCAHLVSNGRISNPDWYFGTECTIQSIPQQVRDKKILKYFREGGFHCIIWNNDEDYTYSV